jgi:hypothetical protein
MSIGLENPWCKPFDSNLSLPWVVVVFVAILIPTL